MHNQEDEVLERFFEESKDNIANIEDDLLLLEQQGDDIDYELVNCIFRAIQAVKGGAVFFGLVKLGELAHYLALILDRVRRRELALSADMVNSLLVGNDLLNTMVNEPSRIYDISIDEVGSSIQAILKANLSAQEREENDEFVDIKLPDGKVIFSVNKYDFQRASEEEKGGSHVYLIKYDLIKDIEAKGKTPWEVISELLQLCVFIDSRVDIDSIGTLDSEVPNSMPFYVLISTIIEIELINDFLELDEDSFFFVNKDGSTGSALSEETPDIADSIMDYISSDDKEEVTSNESALARSNNGTSEGDLLQISGDVFGVLESYVNELIVAKDQLMKNCEARESEEIYSVAEKIGDIAVGLNHAVIDSRKVFHKDNQSFDGTDFNMTDIADRQSLIVLKSGNARFGIPLGIVSKLERVKSDRVICNGSECSMTYRGKRLDLFSICDVLDVGKLEPSEEYIIALIEISDRTVGFVFNAVVTIMNSDSKVNSHYNDKLGVVGLVKLKNRGIYIIDLYRVLFAIRPEWKPDVVCGEASKGVLVVDDSPFFLNYIKKTIEELGLAVYSARNGIEALDVLENYIDDIGVIFTDLQMDRMGGVELAKRVRTEKRFAELPIIALTSVAGEEKKTVNNDVGFVRYVVKLDSYNIGRCCSDMLEVVGYNQEV